MVTSSSTLAAYGAIGAGIPPYEIKQIVTVCKAYSSAVGAGAFVSELFGEAFRELRTVIFLYALPAVFAIITLFACLLCFISIKNMQKVICGAAACGAVSSIVSMVLIGRFSAAFSDSALLSASNGFGLIAAVLMFGVVIIVNALMQKKGIRVEYDEGMEERVAIYRKYKRGEVKIDDLPQPVVETEATRKIDEEIAKEEALFREKAEKEEVEV